MTVKETFDLTGRVAVITGGAGLLGVKHAEAVSEAGGIPVLVDIDGDGALSAAGKLGGDAMAIAADITDEEAVRGILAQVLDAYGRVDILINNAANNPKVEGGGNWSRLENYPLDAWNQDLAVGLTGAFLVSRVIGAEMARTGTGVILNISSDLGLIGPDQRIYADGGLRDDNQAVKPVTYSVVKSGLIGLTRYLATYWADRGVRVNAVAPGGVLQGQDPAFVERLSGLIPMGRMAEPDEYKATVLFMISDASSYMTGAVVSVDGGRTCW
ncbi:MAG: SDR family oxidoreductase [Rhodospirillaceae bacterium]|nr:SDR family oxidoreductase [Rhodospirillaceae bacterium]